MVPHWAHQRTRRGLLRVELIRVAPKLEVSSSPVGGFMSNEAEARAAESCRAAFGQLKPSGSLAPIPVVYAT